MGRNKQISCNICSKAMRNDNLARHIKNHTDFSLEDPEQICKSILEDVINDIPNKDETSMYKRKDPHSNGLDESQGDEIDDEELDQMIVNDDYEYTKKRKLGEKVYKIINNREARQQSLRPEFKEALDLYLKTSVESFPNNIEFKPWQLSILEEVEIPTKRKIIWVLGKSCGEGKTWLQNYIEYKYGDRRVVSGISLQTKSGNITHALTKHPLATADIFLFNIGKSVDTLTEINYDMLEGIKDGKLFTSKYDSQRLKIRVPNVVMVFSNDEPNTTKLAKDRWKLFSIESDQLKEYSI